MIRQGTRRLSTGIEGLDAMIGGGFVPGDLTLVAGAPGTGKTTIGLQFIVAGAEAGEPGVFFTSEYLPQQIYRDAARRGWPLKAWEDEGMVRVVSTPHDTLFAATETGVSLLDEILGGVGAKRFVLDSISAWHREDMRQVMEGLMNHLRLLGVTSMVTVEVPQIVGPSVQLSPWGIEFLVDNVLVLQYVEIDAAFHKAIHVLKFRGGDHDRAFREFHATDHGIEVAAGFEGVERILSGAPTRSFQARARDLV